MSFRTLKAVSGRRSRPAGGVEETVRLGPPRLLRSAGFRFAVLFAAMFTSAAMILMAVFWWATSGALVRQTDAAIRADAIALTERWREAQRLGLIEAIEERLAEDMAGEAIYLLVEAETGRRLAGNLDAWPPGVPQEGGPWFLARVPHDGTPTDARFYLVNLPDLRLLIGRDETERERLQGMLTEGLIWASGAVVAFALLGAWLMRQALERRMRPAFATIAAIADGNLASRVALSGRGDEFDRLAATMNVMLDRIGTLMAGVRGVSDAIAHDLRTPIARARAKLEEALASAPEGTATKEETLRAAVEQGIADLDNISRIFQALLRIAEAEAGARRAAFARFDLPQVLADAAELYEATAEAREQSLTTDLPRRLDLVGDRDLLLQAVANLLDNAIKFTPPGGAVLLSARATEGWVEIAVSDDGPGLAPEDRVHAGERFFRADRSRGTPGSGLGLSLVQAVASLHGGELRLEDAAPGREPPGLRATLRLPLP
ncbi:sensor histidine kinase [Crenalkalicoccus roseus]|uniref:sensor histidine kinase n=1 Tax=Crenalkalicoccus roseus TaxID=1485588 RepID=UPI001080D8CD|nr:ATP-binding protein [Crenalkalicoccus roseus]